MQLLYLPLSLEIIVVVNTKTIKSIKSKFGFDSAYSTGFHTSMMNVIAISVDCYDKGSSWRWMQLEIIAAAIGRLLYET